MRLSDFIAAHLDEILGDFEESARKRTEKGSTMDPEELRDHSKGIVRDIQRHLDQARETGTQGDHSSDGQGESPAEKHGVDRSDVFTLHETVKELGRLRTNILRLWGERAGLPADPTSRRELIRFNQSIDDAVATSVSRHADELQRAEERHRTELERRRVAEETDRIKSDFLRMISHELRTPLNAISGFTANLARGVHGPLAEEQRQVLTRVKQGERKLLSIIDDLLDVQRLNAGLMSYTLEAVAVREVLHEVAETAAPVADDAGVELLIEPEEANAFIRADPDRLRQVLLHLVSNALRFTSCDGQVRVSGEETGNEVCLRVHDTGRGIPASELESIFQPFVQLDSGSTREHGGSGLGLTISRSLVAGMGGRLTVESQPGEGSVFSLFLPKGGPSASSQGQERERG